MFYCREKELGDMNRRYAKNGFECLVVYGRRRVGKTALINEFCKNKPMKRNIRIRKLPLYIRALILLLRKLHVWLKTSDWYL